MPTPEEILRSLTALANQWWPLPAAWHVYSAGLAGGLLWGLRPAQRIGGVLLALPLLSVSALAWTAANPFNGIVLGLASLVLLILALRLPQAPLRLAPPWALAAGALLFAFGWVYPHFLDSFPPLAYLAVAPVGLVPWPTLSIIIGLSLLVDGLEARAWSSLLGITGVFYGLFGALRLGVTIDLVLLAGALLLLLVWLPKTQPQQRVPAH
jgi:hypothetical protein